MVMISVNRYKDKLDCGFTSITTQAENGMYSVEIRDKDDVLYCGCTRSTSSECYKFINDFENSYNNMSIV